MNTKALHTLEYDKIINLLVEQATCETGRKTARELVPMTSLDEINQAQRETEDALTRIYRKGGISFAGTKDILGSLMRLEVGSDLSILELLHICDLLETAGRVKQYAKRDVDDESRDSLDPYFEMLEPAASLSAEIRRCILSEDEVSDDASPDLRKIRRSMQAAYDKISSTLHSMVNSTRAYLQDAVITQRNGRYCLPVKAEYRSQVPGMIHDQSSTGSTLFIEPNAIVKLNNDIREMMLEEEKEIHRILAALSAKAAGYTDAIREDYTLLGQLDFIFAKANLARKMKATRPIFNTKRFVVLKDARHPLLDAKKVVPVSITLGQDFDLLIITGPNTGGKTVSLKTMGLLTLMGQAGLHIPAFQGSRLAVFDDVFADIGDEQSIEQSLSTFSAHMTNIVRILKDASLNSLVLFDELCAGTDPTEGAALAISILDHLHKQGIRTMATTHYSELKVYALSTDGVENGSCEFNVETLSPTYRLLIGIPGKSNAFAISSKLGLPEHLIEDARKQISAESESFEDILTDLEISRKSLEEEKAQIQRYKEDIRATHRGLERKQEKLDAQKDRILREANEEARRILQEAKDYADKTMRDFQKFGKSSLSAKDMEKKRSDLREKLDKTNSKLTERREEVKPKKKLDAASLKIGDSVRVTTLGLDGTVVSLPDAKGNLTVQMGMLHSTVQVKDLILIETAPEPVVTNKTGAGKIKMGKSASVSTEINLLGKTVDEALSELDKYLDDAYLAHLPSVRIVHGKGTGALRKAVQQHLRHVKYVKSFRLGEIGEGDAGVTIAEFK